MILLRALRTVPIGMVGLVPSLLVFGCANLNAYRPDAEVTQSRYAIIENYSTATIDPDRVDAVLTEVAAILKVQLDPAVPQPRIVVTTPDRIARLYEPAEPVFDWIPQARALYFPGSRVVMIPYFERSLLGYVLAPYVTEHYLTAPRAEWERIARSVEWKLAFGTEGSAGSRSAKRSETHAAP